jgi:hypothetical protein
MTEWREWDFDHPRDRPRIEVLPPENRIRVTIERWRPNLAPLFIVALVVFAIWRLKLFGGLVMLAALLGLLH